VVLRKMFENVVKFLIKYVFESSLFSSEQNILPTTIRKSFIGISCIRFSCHLVLLVTACHIKIQEALGYDAL